VSKVVDSPPVIETPEVDDCSVSTASLAMDALVLVVLEVPEFSPVVPGP
jgi:hypothetical protein